MRTELTESQKACLRLVGQGMTSKEIASRVGLTPSTVDTYLRLAIGTLGAANRRDAARRFLEDEGRMSEVSERLRYQSADVAVGPDTVDEAAVPAVEGSPASVQAASHGSFGPPPIGGRENTLSGTERIIEIMRIALFLAAVMTGLVLFAVGAIKILS